MARSKRTWNSVWRSWSPSWWAVAALGGAAGAAAVALAYLPGHTPVQRSIVAFLQQSLWVITASSVLLAAVMLGLEIRRRRKANPYARLRLDREAAFDVPHVGRKAAALAVGQPIIRIREIPPPPAPEGWSLQLLKALEWKRLELLCAGYYRHRNFRVESCEAATDGGSRALLYFKEIRKPVAVLALKAWGSRPVGVKPVRDLADAMAQHGVPRGYFHAAGDFTRDARTFAAAHHIQLVTGAELLANIAGLPQAVQQALLELTASGDYTTPTCPACGGRMVMCSSDRGDFWGCSDYPRCKTVLLLAHDAW